MKMSYVSSRLFKSVSTLKGISLVAALGSAAVISACGGKFSAIQSAKIPVITADPSVAEKERLRQAQATGETEVSYFNTEAEEKAFNAAMNEGASDFDFDALAKKLETEPESGSKVVPEFDENAADPDADNAPAAPVTTTVEPGGPAVPADGKVTEVPHAETAAPKHDDKQAAAPSDLKLELPAGTNGEVAPTLKRRALAVPMFAKDICGQTNIKSAATENIDSLYTDTSALPKDLPAEQLRQKTSVEKQNQFICKLLPHALRMNAEVFSQRLYLSRLQYRSIKGTLSEEDQRWIAGMKRAYGVEDKGSIEDLLKRVDIVPLPMLLAQAAVESGWGTSGAVLKANNLFGVHATKDKNCLPSSDNNGTGCLKRFGSITESVAHYIRLLNRGSHYGEFRELRAGQRKNGHRLDSEALIDTMKKYSTRGADYTTAVKRIMSGHNNLTKYNIDEKKMAAAVQEPTK